MDNPEVFWPEIFTNPDFEYPVNMSEKKLRETAMTDALIGWGNCYISAPPAHFGHGMIKCSKIVGHGQLTPATIFEISEKVFPKLLPEHSQWEKGRPYFT